eukprot:jgi/Chrpa1/18033/Chrysochromulina_OHIO_Genome00004914-RA
MRASRPVALVGSSGGSTLRGTAASEHAALSLQLEGSGCRLGWMVYVEALEPLDHARRDLEVGLFRLQDSKPVATVRKPLASIKALVVAADVELAQRIAAGEVAALIIVSADVNGANEASVNAAVHHGVPMLGTGGTGLGLATEKGAFVLQLSGSVSTTADSRAMATAAALARHFGTTFRPTLPASELHVLPVIDAALPVVVCLAVVLRVLALLPALPLGVGAAAAMVSVVAHVRASLLPLVVAAVGGARAAALGESGGIAGLVAGSIATRVGCMGCMGCMGVLGDAWPGGMRWLAAPGPVAPAALAAGYAGGLVARRVMVMAHRRGLPATASSHLVSAGAGLVGGLMGVVLAPPLSMLIAALTAVLVWPASLPTPLAALAGGLAGAATLGGSIRGYYHGVMLPLIVAEMAEGGLSMLGALDAACLCATCAGVMCAVEAHARRQQQEEEEHGQRRRPVSTGWTAASINLLFGDYVEACYPYMERRFPIRLGTYAGAVAAGALIVASGPSRSSAYLPLPLAVAIAEAPSAMLGACLVAFLVPFVATAATLKCDALAQPPTPGAISLELVAAQQAGGGAPVRRPPRSPARRKHYT